MTMVAPALIAPIWVTVVDGQTLECWCRWESCEDVCPVCEDNGLCVLGPLADSSSIYWPRRA